MKRSFDSIERPSGVQLSTFGFSNNLSSALLQDLAIRGGGIFGFIPDQSMIGTIFINYLANTFLTMAQDVFLDVGGSGGGGGGGYEFSRHDLPKTCLQFGKVRHYLLTRNDNAASSSAGQQPFRLSMGFTAESMVDIKLAEITPNTDDVESYRVQLAKYKMLNLVMHPKLASSGVDVNEYVSSSEIKNVAAFWKELAQEPNENDANNEQIRLGLVHWSSWGAHYIR